MCEPWAAPAAPRAVKPPPITPSTHSQAQCHPAYTEPASQEPLSTRTHRLPQKRDAVTRPHVAVTWRTICTSSFFLQQQPSSLHRRTQRSTHSMQPPGSASIPAGAFPLMQFWGAGSAPWKPAVSSPGLSMLREALEPRMQRTAGMAPLGVLPARRAAGPPGAASRPGMANPQCQLLETALIKK